MKTFTKNEKKKLFKKIAESAAATRASYERLSRKSAKYGDFIVTLYLNGYEAFRKEGDNYVPVSFHCEHNRFYAHEIWEAKPSYISKREVEKGSDEASPSDDLVMMEYSRIYNKFKRIQEEF